MFRRLRGRDEPFGGCQVIATGDFLQLPPVRISEVEPYDWAFQSPAWAAAGFRTFVLETVRRQDEPGFVRALADFRVGRVWGDTARLLQSRVRAFPPADMPRLFTHNTQVDRWNNFQLEELAGEERVFAAIESGPEQQLEFLKKNLLTPETLRLKSGALVMFTVIHNGAYAIFEQEVTATDLILRLNGNTEATHVMTGIAANVSKPIYLGSRNASWCFNGLVRDLLVYEGNPSPADKTRIRNFLISTYGLPTPYPPPPVPGAPADLGGEATGIDAYLWWDMTNVRYTTGVEIERKALGQPDSAFAVVGDAGPGGAEFNDFEAGPATMVYRVRAFNAGGYSGYSNTVTITF